MKRYALAYGAWLAFVLAAAAVALAWYRYVEEIGLRELGARLNDGIRDNEQPND